LIEVKHLVKRYGDNVALDDINFTVEDGNIYGFLGPNGAGKTTTMNIMTGYLTPTEGEVIINGHSIAEEPEKAKSSIGYLPEIPPLYTDMTVTEYLKFAAELKKLPKAERAASVSEVIAAQSWRTSPTGSSEIFQRATSSAWGWHRRSSACRRS
jgi:ABC-2 type transport system ATP-binding protein